MTYKNIYKNILLYLFVCMICAGFSHGQSQNAGQEDSRTYTVGAHDLLTINVFGVDELNTRVRISGNGAITLPLLGEVRVEGLTTAQLETKLAGLLEQKYLKDAQVSVFIVEYQSKKVSVIGAVQHPGNYELLGKETLLQLISKAGGLTDRASNTVVVIHKEKSRVIDLDELMTKGTPQLNILMEPGDVVNIPHERYMDIYIFGQVRNPGTLRLKKSGKASLLRAIAQAGGFTTRARKSSVLITRRENDKEIKIRVNVKKILKGKRQPFVLKHDDIVYVPESLL